jgi:hypothetical protein
MHGGSICLEENDVSITMEIKLYFIFIGVGQAPTNIEGNQFDIHLSHTFMSEANRRI